MDGGLLSPRISPGVLAACVPVVSSPRFPSHPLLPLLVIREPLRHPPCARLRAPPCPGFSLSLVVVPVGLDPGIRGVATVAPRAGQRPAGWTSSSGCTGACRARRSGTGRCVQCSSALFHARPPPPVGRFTPRQGVLGGVPVSRYHPALSALRVGLSRNVPAMSFWTTGPWGLSMGLSAAVVSCLAQYATFSGRATRAEFWCFQLFVIAVTGGGELTAAVLIPTVSGRRDRSPPLNRGRFQSACGDPRGRSGSGAHIRVPTPSTGPDTGASAPGASSASRGTAKRTPARRRRRSATAKFRAGTWMVMGSCKNSPCKSSDGSELAWTASLNRPRTRQESPSPCLPNVGDARKRTTWLLFTIHRRRCAQMRRDPRWRKRRRGQDTTRTIRTGMRWQVAPNAVFGLEGTQRTDSAGEGHNEVRLRAALRF